MSSRQRRSVLGRRLWSVALTWAALAVMAAGPSAALAASPGLPQGGKTLAAQQTPNQTIDAKANPVAAANALNSGCADTSKCTWNNDTPITGDYGPPSTLGDVLYNCSPGQYAETAVGVEDERQESTSVSERV